MRGFADLLAERTHSRVLVPTHPGFGGTPRPAGLASTRGLAAAYIALLDELDFTDVTVIGTVSAAGSQRKWRCSSARGSRAW